MEKMIRSSYGLIIVIALFLVPGMLFPQLQKASRTKLDSRLQQIVDQARKQPAMQKLNAQSVQSVTSAEGKQQFPCFVHSDDMQRLRSDGIPLQTVIGTFATARLTVEELELLENHTAVQFVEPTTVEYPHNDVAAALSGADVLHSGNVNSTQYTGSGVIVGIIDTGIDWDHLDFRDPTDPTQSRILYIWDQTLTATGAESTPASFAYGVEYTKAHIDAELDGAPIIDVRETDINGHGTHVAGTAAGNGSALSTDKYKGMAPDADIIVVKAGNGSFSTTNIVDAITYMDAKATAAGKPLVINMSLGSDAGPHDGTDAKGLAVKNYSGPGRIAVMSAGNSGADPIHFSGTIGALSSSTVTFTVPAYTAAGGASNDVFGFDVWLADGTAVTAQVTTPNAFSATQVSGTDATTSTNDGSIYLYNYIDSDNSDREIYSEISDASASFPPASGTWTLQMTNTTGSSVTYHGWLYAYTLGGSTVTVAGGNSSYTIDNCSDSAITVGSYVSRWRWNSSDANFYSGGTPDHSDDISSFSSIGPSRTGAQKPDIAAPGQHIVSTRSTDASFAASSVVPGGLHVKNQGTSMSSPVVAGSVALLLQQNPSYSTLQVKSLVTSTALTDGYTGGSLPDAYWGYGKLDILHAMVKAIDDGFTFARSIPAYDEWTSTSGLGSLTPGLKIATKFSPAINGKITGALFHPYTTLSLTGPLSVEVWSDNGSGLPNAKLGTTVSADQNSLLKYSWNAVDMTGSGVSVSSGTDYHLVLYYTSGTELSIALDAGSVDNRSHYDAGGGWTAYSADFRIRPVIMTDVSLLPVELVAFSGAATEHGVMLQWNTASEVNSYGFDVERKTIENGKLTIDNWKQIGFVEGNGTSNSPHAYSFADRNLRPGRFSYRLKMIDRDGKFSYSNEIEVSFGPLPKKFSLEQNYPNPFNPATEIRYQMPEVSRVSLKVYDMLGREVQTLVNEVKEAGEHTAEFKASSLPSGVYFYTLRTNNFTATKKMLLLK